MQKEFVNYEIALALKELGFNKECFNRFYTKPQSKMFGVDEKGRHYPIKNISKKLYTMGEDFVLNDSNVILAPTFSQAFKFFREKYDLDVISKPHIGKTKKYICDPVNIRLEAKNTYEEAELACLKKLIEIVKNK
jgi:hypothetical protein